MSSLPVDAGQSRATTSLPTRPRLTSLDVFRGFTILAMIIVNTPGDYAHTYPLLLHAEWERLTPTDLVFPFFLFIVGVALAAALRPYLAQTPPESGRRAVDRAFYLKLCRRALVLVLLGLLLNGLPGFDLATWRIPGVLQRTGICFLAAALIYVHVPPRWQWGIGAAILVGYAYLLRFVGAPGVLAGQIEPTANLSRWLDLAVFSPAHVFSVWPTEPEGILSTPAAIVTVLLGCWTGAGVVHRPPSLQRGLNRVVAGLTCAGLGWAGSGALPMIKMIWTPTYVLFSGGCAMAGFGLLYLLTDVRPAPRPAWVLQVFGRNAILAYVLSEVAAIALGRITIHETSLPEYVAQTIGGAMNGRISAEMGSLAYAGFFALAMWAVLYLPYRRKWFVSI